jgi:hypothetical protein
MNLMIMAGSACWVMELITLGAFLSVCRDTTNLKGYILKGAASLMVILYGMTLILLYTLYEGHPFSEASILFMVGLFFAFLGDMGIATMQLRHGGSSKSLFEKLSAEQMTIGGLTFAVVGVLFIISFFLEMVAFVKGIRGDIETYVTPFLLMFLVPILLTFVGGLLSQFKIPEVSTKIFTIAVFYILLTSALFASISVYSFWMYQYDPRHAAFVFSAGILFVLSVLLIALRYSRPDKYETRPIRFLARLLNYISRMMLAGCAFLF